MTSCRTAPAASGMSPTAAPIMAAGTGPSDDYRLEGDAPGPLRDEDRVGQRVDTIDGQYDVRGL